MQEKSLLEYAYDVMLASKEPMSFKDLFDKALELSGIELSQSEIRTKMSKLYTQLSLDGRFAILTDNLWDLSARHKFSERHIEMEDAYSDDDDDENDEEEAKLLRKELGEEDELDEEDESDDLDFDKPTKSSDDGEDDF